METTKTVLGELVVLGLMAIFATSMVSAAEQEQIVIEDLTVPQLRAEIEKVQTEYYNVFNRLNEDDEFDIVCQKFTPTGSNIPQIGCEPTFVSKRRGANANESRLGTDELMTNDALIKDLQPQFQQLTDKLNQIAKENDYFRELGQVLQMLRGRLNELNS